MNLPDYKPLTNKELMEPVYLDEAISVIVILSIKALLMDTIVRSVTCPRKGYLIEGKVYKYKIETLHFIPLYVRNKAIIFKKLI